MRDPRLTEGRYLVVERFGFTRVYRAESDILSNRWFIYVRVSDRYIGPTKNEREHRDRMERRGYRKSSRGRVLLLAVRSVRFQGFFDLLLGHPCGFTHPTYLKAAEMAHARQTNPLLLAEKMIIWMPARMRPYVFGLALMIIDTFFPVRKLRRIIQRKL